MLDEAVPEASLPDAPPCIPSGLPDTSIEDDGRAGPVADGNRRVDDEDDLVGRARRGDRDAFGELFRLHHGRLYRFARAHVGEAADDVVAETFLRAWRALARYRPTGAPFAAWLYGIARHVVADELRRMNRVSVTSDVPDRATGGSEDDRLVLAAAIRRLPDRQRQVIELKFLVGLSNEEVGRALGTSPGAVNATQWRALESLRRMLEGAWTEG